MITIKYDDKLLKAAKLVKKSPNDLVNEIIRLIALFKIAEDEYAGEVLGTLIWDSGLTMKAFIDNLWPGEEKKTTKRIVGSLAMLNLYFTGSDNACPDCGWEKAECIEDHTWFCPHCGWSELMFLSEQNED